MARALDATIGRQVTRLWQRGTLSGLDDSQLLRKYFAERDETAFEALVARLGPLVLGVCKRTLSDPHDVEDAFQATFLVLVRRAAAIQPRAPLGPWMYGVARRVALRAGANTARRRAREQPSSVASAITIASPDPVRREVLEALDAAVERLPAPFRDAVVLCCLQGYSCAEAAARLGCAEGTIKSRIARAKKRLHRLLTARGLAPAAIVLQAFFCPPRASGVLTRTQVERTARAAVHALGARQVARAGVSATAAALAETTIASSRFYGAIRALLLAAGLGAALFVAALAARELGQDEQTPPRGVAQAPGIDRARLIGALLDALQGVSAHAGRGSFLVYALDISGHRRLVRAQPNRDGNFDYVEEFQDLRWAVVTGIVPQEAIRDRLARAFAVDRSLAYPEYLRVDLERQARPPRGEWSNWHPVDRAVTLRVLNNIPEAAGERTSPTVRNDALVDILPFSRTPDCWKDADHPAFPAVPAQAAQAPLAAQQAPLAAQSDAPELMLRILDFSVDPGWRYRYRARIVVADRLAERGRRAEVRPPAKAVAGPWSEPTGEVLIVSEAM